MKLNAFILLTLLMIAGLFSFTNGQSEFESDSLSTLQIIDTHIHLYDTNRSQGVDWPPVTDKVLYRPVLTEHFDEVADRAGIASTVIVEASSRVEDNQWMLDLVKHNPDR